MSNYYIPDIDKMYTHLKAFFKGAGYTEAYSALAYAREKHKEQKRGNGQAYIIHPLSMACYAEALGVRDDLTFAVILLHDILEDCGVTVSELPFSDKVKSCVNLLTIKKFKDSEHKLSAKIRYYNELLDNPIAVIVKGFDRYNNLTDMPFGLKSNAVGKNVAETELLLLPILKQAHTLYPEYSDLLYALRWNIRATNDMLRKFYADDYIEWYRAYKSRLDLEFPEEV